MIFHVLFEFEDWMNYVGCGSDRHDILWILALLVGVVQVSRMLVFRSISVYVPRLRRREDSSLD
jgi:hypothetical protein